MNTPFDPYKELGVKRNADTDEIRRAYRKRAKAAHPDGSGSEEAFKRLNKAHRLLTDESSRKRYDETGNTEEVIDNQDGPALQVMVNFFNRLAQESINNNANNDILGEDLMIIGKRFMEVNIKDFEEQKIKVKRTIEVFSKIEQRIKPKKKGPLKRMLAHQLQMMQVLAGNLENQIAAHKRAYELFGEYDFERLIKIQQVGSLGGWREIQTPGGWFR